jgi:hypothetical protein
MITLNIPVWARIALTLVVAFVCGAAYNLFVGGPLGLPWWVNVLAALVTMFPLVWFSYDWRYGRTDRVFTRGRKGVHR